MAHDHHSHRSDMKAAFLGFALGAVALLVIMSTMVYLTNWHYGKKHPPAEAHR